MGKTGRLVASVVALCALCGTALADQPVPPSPTSPLPSAVPAASDLGSLTQPSDPRIEASFAPFDSERKPSQSTPPAPAPPATAPAAPAEGALPGLSTFLNPFRSDASEDDSSPYYRSFESGVPLIELVDVEGRPTSAEFPHAYKVPGTEIWWKLGGFIKADVIHDFNPITSGGQFFPPDILTNGTHGQDTILQASATRLNVDFRAPTAWGVGRAFIETDFFTSDNEMRLRHAYIEDGSLLAGQTWTLWTDPEARPKTLDFESPVSFTLLRHAQVRWTERLSRTLDWAISIEDPITDVDSFVTTTLPGQPEQPYPDIVTRIKYHGSTYQGVAALLLRDLVYRPDDAPAQNRLGWGVNLIGILHLTDSDILDTQVVFGQGLGSYRGGADLTLSSPTRVAPIPTFGAYAGLTHFWIKTLSSTAVYSFGVRGETGIDPPDTLRSTNYVAINLIWEPVQRLMMGIEYLYGTRTDKDGDFGQDSRIQCTVQYTLP